MIKNTLFISIDGLSDPLGQSQIIPYLKIISKKNENLYVYSMEKKNNFNKNNKKIQKIFTEYKIHWKYTHYFMGMGKFSNLINYSKLFFICLKILVLKDINVIHGRGHIPSLFGFIIKKLLKKKLIFDFRGFWVDERVDNNSLILSNYIDLLIYKINKFLEYKIIKNSDKIVCLTYKARNEIIKKFNYDLKDIVVIPCCTDYNFFNINKKSYFNELIRKKFNIPITSNVFSYCGSLGGVYMIDKMINFFIEYAKINKNSYFLIITNNVDIAEKYLSNLNKISEIEKIIIINLDRNSIPQYLSITNIFLSFIKNSYARLAMSPTKISECLSLGIPVIINRGIGDTEDILKVCDSGYVFDISKSNYIKKIIDEIPKLISLDENNIKSKSEELLDIKVAKIRYSMLYDTL